ncbi:MAG TPA: FAD-dependent oxidoreductase, partial [Saprospiraceae bacterium]|nr:FAD-dependent oxidoreductase [Saprospiraceae bacterium]
TLKGIGIEFILGQSVQSVIQNKKRIQLVYKDKSNDSDHQLEADYCLVAIGRKAYTDGLELNQIDLQLDEKGKIPVNENCQTKVKNIFAIGDVIHGPMLAHKAEEEGVFVAEYLSGQKPKLNHNLIPGVVYTWPEMTSVGMTEESLKEKNIKYKIGKFPFKALGRARASMDMDGFVKILADADSDEILGVHIVGARAADLIMEAAALMEFKSTAEDMSRICHPHPTFSEGLKEAALDATGKRAIHM